MISNKTVLFFISISSFVTTMYCASDSPSSSELPQDLLFQTNMQPFSLDAFAALVRLQRTDNHAAFARWKKQNPGIPPRKRAQWNERHQAATLKTCFCPICCKSIYIVSLDTHMQQKNHRDAFIQYPYLQRIRDAYATTDVSADYYTEATFYSRMIFLCKAPDCSHETSTQEAMAKHILYSHMTHQQIMESFEQHMQQAQQLALSSSTETNKEEGQKRVTYGARNKVKCPLLGCKSHMTVGDPIGTHFRRHGLSISDVKDLYPDVYEEYAKWAHISTLSHNQDYYARYTINEGGRKKATYHCCHCQQAGGTFTCDNAPAFVTHVKIQHLGKDYRIPTE